MLLEELFTLWENESKLRQAIKRFGPMIDENLSREVSFIANRFEKEPDTVRKAVAPPFGQWPSAEGIIRYIKSFDPTHQGTYTLWMIDRWFKGTYKLEDLPRVHDYLDLFNRKRALISEKDIERYEKPQDVLAVIRQFMAHGKDVSEHEAFFRMRDQSIVFLDNERWRVVEPLTKESAGFWGRNTEWCITWGEPGTRYPDRDENYFEEYTRDGPFLIIHDKRDKTDWALHLAGANPTFWDADDNQHDVGEVLENELKYAEGRRNSWLQGDVLETVRLYVPNLIAVLEGTSERAIALALDENPQYIQYLPDPTPEQQMIAFMASPQSVLKVRRPDQAVIEKVSERHPSVVLYLKNPTEEQMIACVRKRPDFISHFRNATERVMIAAVETNGMMLGHIMNSPDLGPRVTRRVIETAIKHDAGAISYIDEPDFELQMFVVRRNGRYIDSIRTSKILDPRVCAAAARQDPGTLAYIFTSNKTDDAGKRAAYLAAREKNERVADLYWRNYVERR